MGRISRILADTFVFDIDGTLVDESLMISSKNRQALHLLNKKGYRLILASGRMLKAVRRFMEEQIGFCCPCISYNGSILWVPENGIIAKTTIDSKIAVKVLDFLRKEGIHRQAYIDDQLFVEEDNDYVKSYCERSDITYTVVKDLIKLVEKRGESIKLLAIATEEKLDAVKEKARELFGDCLEIFKSFPTYLDFVPKGVNKGYGLRKLSKELGFSLNKTVAFGDNENDFEMLKEVGYPVVIGGASKKLINISFMHDPNVKEGVYNVLKKILPELFT